MLTLSVADAIQLGIQLQQRDDLDGAVATYRHACRNFSVSGRPGSNRKNWVTVASRPGRSNASSSTTFRVLLDGELVTPITTAGGGWSSDATVRSYRVADRVSAGEHDLQLYRNPEAMFGVVEFDGFVPTNGDLVESSPPYGRRVEIIGDSTSAGCGNDDCPFFATTEIGSAAYGPRAARRLGAVAHVEAWSGTGMALDRDGSTTALVPDLHGYAAPDDDQTGRNHGAYVPDAIVIHLGTNDFNGGVNRNDSIAAHETFVTRARPIQTRACRVPSTVQPPPSATRSTR